jgi:hypothetical protein
MDIVSALLGGLLLHGWITNQRQQLVAELRETPETAALRARVAASALEARRNRRAARRDLTARHRQVMRRYWQTSLWLWMRYQWNMPTSGSYAAFNRFVTLAEMHLDQKP